MGRPMMTRSGLTGSGEPTSGEGVLTGLGGLAGPISFRTVAPSDGALTRERLFEALGMVLGESHQTTEAAGEVTVGEE